MAASSARSGSVQAGPTAHAASGSTASEVGSEARWRGMVVPIVSGRGGVGLRALVQLVRELVEPIAGLDGVERATAHDRDAARRHELEVVPVDVDAEHRRPLELQRLAVLPELHVGGMQLDLAAMRA